MKYILKDLDSSQKTDFIDLTKKLRHEWKIPETEFNAGSLHRFYFSQNFNAMKTSQAIKSHIKWRQQFPFDKAADLPKNTYDVISKHAAIGLYGNDKEGRPIGYISSKVGYPFEAVHILGPDQITLYQIQMFERLCNIVFPLCSKKYEKNINNMICIIDAKEVTCPSKMLIDYKLMDFIFTIMKLYKENYPEMNYKSVVINSNFLVMYSWSVLKKFLKQTTIDKFSFYDQNYLEGLLQITTIDKIPKQFGGTCPYAIEEYPNFFNPEIKKSVQAKKLTI